MISKKVKFDYPALEALDLIVSSGTFEAAAKLLNITQSAISQRIKQLERQYGQKLLLRKASPVLTLTGEKLLIHYRRVKSLEREWSQTFLSEELSARNLRISVNRDSLATWLPKSLGKLIQKGPVTCEFFTMDESRTQELLFNGQVDACISTLNFQKSSFVKRSLGSMSYRCQVSERAYHAKGNRRERVLSEMPFVLFDQDDKLYESFFSKKKTPRLFHQVPDSSGFFSFIKLGYGYSLIPDLQVSSTVKLVNLFPKQLIKVPLYLYYWEGVSFETRQLLDEIKFIEN